MTAAPIFIVGSPRSGTTLLRQILNRHPRLAICGETHFRPLVYLRRKAFGDLSDLKNRRHLVHEYLASSHMHRVGLNSAEFAERLTREATSYKAMFACMLDCYADSQGKPRCGEKTPQHALFLETLCEWFPDAIILHTVRDPRASVASLLRTHWSRGSVVTNARRWLRLTEVASQFRERPGYLEVRYESLVTDPVPVLRKICSLLGEEYSPAMLVPEEDAAEHSDGDRRSRTAVTAARQDVWRKQLTAAQVAQIEWVVGPQLERFGYARQAAPASAFTVLRGVSYSAFDFARFAAARLPALWYRFGSKTKIAKYEYWAGPRIWRKRA